MRCPPSIWRAIVCFKPPVLRETLTDLGPPCHLKNDLRPGKRRPGDSLQIRRAICHVEDRSTIPSCSTGQSQEQWAEVSRRYALGSNEKEFLLIRVVYKWNGETGNCKTALATWSHFSLKLYTGSIAVERQDRWFRKTVHERSRKDST